MHRITKSEWASHVIVALAVLGVLLCKLTAGAIAGFLVYTLSLRLKAVLDRRGGNVYARRGALALVIVGVVLLVLAAAVGVWQLAKSQHGVAGISGALLGGLDRMHESLPVWLDAYVPASVDGAKTAAVDMLRKYSAELSAVGMGTLRLAAHVLIGLVAGAMLAWGEFASPEQYRPLSRALFARFGALSKAFRRVVFSQFQVSLLNTVLSAIYLEIVLPLAGVHLPFTKALIGFTFVAGLVPVAGNLVSNSVILIASLGVSTHAGIASLVFLVLVHKLEYFANARIVGHNIEAKAWEIIIAMVGMEALFGVTGVIVAPILYAYIKSELKRLELIGRYPDVTPTSDAGSNTNATARKSVELAA